MDNIYYVYAYLDPTKPIKGFYDGLDLSFLFEPFYIGKGKEDRYVKHLQDYKLKNKNYLSNKINKLRSKSLEPIIVKLFENLTENDAFELEVNLINKIGKKIEKRGPLVNIVNGGEGVSGLKHSQESRSKMSLKGEKHPNWGKSLKESTRNKISQRLKLNNPMHKPEISEKVRQKNIGREPWNKGKTEERPDIIKKLSEKKMKYKNIKAISKETGNVLEFNNTNEIISFLNKTHRMIMIYFEKGESKDYFWTFDKI
jgi:group I intron endonuclease